MNGFTFTLRFKIVNGLQSVTTTNSTFNAANQLVKVGTQDYTVDANGNLTNDGRYQYTWNAFDELTEVKTTTGTLIATYQYDENGRRIYSKVGTKETYYRYDGETFNVLFEENEAGEIVKAYTYDEKGSLLTMMVGDKAYYYLTNYRGDVLALSDENGTVVAEYTYDAWGNILTQTGELAKENPYRYAGYRYDEETKLYYLIARYYNPDTGVFLSLAPEDGDITNPITMNGHNYANNNPVIFVDPDGHKGLSLKSKKGSSKAKSKGATKTEKPKKVTTPTKIGPGKINFNGDGVKHVENRHIGNKPGWEHKSK